MEEIISLSSRQESIEPVGLWMEMLSSITLLLSLRYLPDPGIVLLWLNKNTGCNLPFRQVNVLSLSRNSRQNNFLSVNIF
jgi:hypothetical protein